MYTFNKEWLLFFWTQLLKIIHMMYGSIFSVNASNNTDTERINMSLSHIYLSLIFSPSHQLLFSLQSKHCEQFLQYLHPSRSLSGICSHTCITTHSHTYASIVLFISTVFSFAMLFISFNNDFQNIFLASVYTNLSCCF